MVQLGATLPFEISSRSSFSLIGYSGPGHVSWIRQESHPRYKGQSYVTQVIPPPEDDSGNSFHLLPNIPMFVH